MTSPLLPPTAVSLCVKLTLLITSPELAEVFAHARMRSQSRIEKELAQLELLVERGEIDEADVQNERTMSIL